MSEAIPSFRTEKEIKETPLELQNTFDEMWRILSLDGTNKLVTSIQTYYDQNGYMTTISVFSFKFILGICHANETFDIVTKYTKNITGEWKVYKCLGLSTELESISSASSLVC